MLVHLGHAELLDEEFFNFLQLINLLVDLVHLHVSVHDFCMVAISCLLAYERLRLLLHVLELPLRVCNVVSHLPLAEIFVLLFSDSALEQLFLLGYQDSLHAKCPLLLLHPLLADFLHVIVLGFKVSLATLELLL